MIVCVGECLICLCDGMGQLFLLPVVVVTTLPTATVVTADR